MAYCENCGTKLGTNDRFCENCGEKVISVATAFSNSRREKGDIGSGDAVFSLFKRPDWQSKWKKTALFGKNCGTGIILTREKALLDHLANGSAGALHGAIAEYTQFCRSRGVEYYYLDCDNNAVSYGCHSVEEIVELLKNIDAVAHPDYLFILGNEEVIDVAVWEDRTGDDEDIESDWCYTVLDTSSPWNNGRFNLQKALRVGRLPVYRGEDFALFKSYFDAVRLAACEKSSVKTYGLSAQVWEDESNHEYRSFARGRVDASPEVTLDDIEMHLDPAANVFFFNLHGSNETEYWYGQKFSYYPEAVSPAVFSGTSKPCVIGVEACYGARYTRGLTAEDSILLNAMTHNCISFVGSSRIAYGTPSPPGSCADVVVGEFLRQITGARSAGDAFLQGIRELVSSSGSFDDTESKTVMEFNLYGDPSVSISSPGIKYAASALDSHGLLGNLHSKIEVPLPEIRLAVQMERAKVNAQIEQLIDEFVFRKYFRESDMKSASEIRQKTFRLPGAYLNQKVFSRKLRNFSQIVKVYFDDQGQVRKVYESK